VSIVSWFKAGISGFLGALVMFVIMKLAIIQGVAPFQVSPSTAFLTQLELPAQPLALVMHFGYGIFWSIVLVAIFWDRTSATNGIGLGLALWIFMMVVYSPIIGWGFFGFDGYSKLPEKLQLSSSINFLVSTFLLHLIYGAVIGWLNSRWITFGVDVAQEIRQERKKDEI
jgi:uncharacterized membrane protein YagU involved in acid resistance